MATFIPDKEATTLVLQFRPITLFEVHIKILLRLCDADIKPRVWRMYH